MPDVELTEMDLAVIECLYGLSQSESRHPLPPDLEPCLGQRFPAYDELAMRSGESITRLRGRGLVEIDAGGRLVLTENGVELAEGLVGEIPQSAPPAR